MTSPFGLIQFTGDKALSVLQGQCTQMVTDLDEGHAPLLAFCDPKGRMFGSGRLVTHQHVVSMITPLDQSEAILNRLKPFLMLSRVTAEVTSIPVALTCGRDIPPGKSHHDSTLTRVGEHGDTQWVIGDAQTVHDPDADYLRLESGLGFVRSFSAEQCIPQQAHYQMLGGVNFKKGCYTGQEVIARLEHLGQAKKHAWIYKSSSAIDDETIDIDGHTLPIFDSVTTDNGSIALVLAAADSASEQLVHVPFQITRQVEGQRPVKL
jgi:folate-binding protein YgfZ